MKPLIGLAAAAISISAVAGFRPIHKAADYNQVIENADHQSQRVPPIGYDDSTGEWGGDWNDNGQFVPPTQPGVDLIPPPEPEPEITEYTINCGCSKVLTQADGGVNPINGACFKPERARGSMGTAYFNGSYGNFWLDGDVEFIATFNIEGDSPAITKIDISNGSEQKTVTSDIVNLGLFAFEPPTAALGGDEERICGVTLYNPARRYTSYSKYKWHESDNGGARYHCTVSTHYIHAGYDSINSSNAYSATNAKYSSSSGSTCGSGTYTSHYY